MIVLSRSKNAAERCTTESIGAAALNDPMKMSPGPLCVGEPERVDMKRVKCALSRFTVRVRLNPPEPGESRRGECRPTIRGKAVECRGQSAATLRRPRHRATDRRKVRIGREFR